MRAHRAAVIAFYQAELSGIVFKPSEVTKKAAGLKKYAVVFIAPSQKVRSRYTSVQNRDVFTVTVHSVGVDEDSALWVAERVDKLTGKTLAVVGRSLFPVEFVTGQPPMSPDDDAPTPLWYSVSQFDITSDPI